MTTHTIKRPAALTSLVAGILLSVAGAAATASHAAAFSSAAATYRAAASVPTGTERVSYRYRTYQRRRTHYRSRYTYRRPSTYTRRNYYRRRSTYRPRYTYRRPSAYVRRNYYRRPNSHTPRNYYRRYHRQRSTYTRRPAYRPHYTQRYRRSYSSSRSRGSGIRTAYRPRQPVSKCARFRPTNNQFGLAVAITNGCRAPIKAGICVRTKRRVYRSTVYIRAGEVKRVIYNFNNDYGGRVRVRGCYRGICTPPSC